MNEIQIFKNSDFGEIRTVEIDGEAWFVGVDIARALGYRNLTNAVNNNVDEGDSLKKGVSDRNGHTQQAIVINESGLYSLIFGSKLESAKKFKRWVTSEVLPALHRKGSYSIHTDYAGRIKDPAKLLELHYLAIRQIDEKADRNKQEIDSVRADFESFKMDLPILNAEESRIICAVEKRAIELMGGKRSNAYKTKWMKKRVSSYIYGELHRIFGIRTFKALKRCQCDKAIEIIDTYALPVEVQDAIDMNNAQMCISIK